MELGQGRVRLGVRERVCTQRLLKHWDRLPRAVNMAPSLLEFKKCLDSALRHMVCFLAGHCAARSWTQRSLCVPSSSGQSVILRATQDSCLFDRKAGKGGFIGELFQRL